MRLTFSLLAGFLLGLLMTNSAESSKAAGSRPSSQQCPKDKSTSFMKWFLDMVERAENQGVKLEPLSWRENALYNK